MRADLVTPSDVKRQRPARRAGKQVIGQDRPALRLATSISGVMPASPVWADSEVGRVIAHGGMFGSFVTLNRSAVGLFESRPGESSGRFGG